MRVVILVILILTLAKPAQAEDPTQLWLDQDHPYACDQIGITLMPVREHITDPFREMLQRNIPPLRHLACGSNLTIDPICHPGHPGPSSEGGVITCWLEITSLHSSTVINFQAFSVTHPVLGSLSPITILQPRQGPGDFIQLPGLVNTVMVQFPLELEQLVYPLALDYQDQDTGEHVTVLVVRSWPPGDA